MILEKDLFWKEHLIASEQKHLNFFGDQLIINHS